MSDLYSLCQLPFFEITWLINISHWISDMISIFIEQAALLYDSICGVQMMT